MEGPMEQLPAPYFSTASRGPKSKGLQLSIVTPKKLTFALAGKKPVTREVTALTVSEALKEIDVELDKHPHVPRRAPPRWSHPAAPPTCARPAGPAPSSSTAAPPPAPAHPPAQ